MARQTKRNEYIEIAARCSRKFWLWSLFEASLFTVCTARLQWDTTSGRVAATAPLPAANKQSARQINASRLSELANSAQVKRNYARYSLIILWLYVYFVSVSIVSVLLDIDAFALYRYIDCYWLGRFTLNGRASLATKYVCLQVAIGMLIVRLSNSLIRKDFYMQFSDFVYKDLAYVEQCVKWHNLKCHKMIKPCWSAPGLNVSNEEDYHIYYKLTTNFKSGPKLLRELHQNETNAHQKDQWRSVHDDARLYDDVMFAKIDYSPTSGAGDELVILKLNRLPNNWRTIVVTMFAAFIFWLAVLIFWLVLILYIATPSIVSKRGFEYMYPNCVDYIRRLHTGAHTARASEFAFIYQLPLGNTTKGFNSSQAKQDTSAAKLADANVIVPMEDLVSGQYHMIRIVIDYIVSVIFLVDAVACVVANMYLQLPIYYDTIVNANEIYKRLVRLRTVKWQQATKGQFCFVEEHEEHEQVASRSKRHHLRVKQMLFPIKPAIFISETHARSHHVHYSLDNLQHLAHSTSIESLLLQALLLEHFKTLKKYNEYLTLCVIISVYMWLGFTCTMLVWLGISGSQAVYYEFYIAELSTSLALFGLLFMSSSIARLNRKFHPLITSLIALDGTSSRTKQRWLTIANHFHPKPMYCIEFMSNKVNFLFLVKVVASSLSAMSVVLSFFHFRKQG